MTPKGPIEIHPTVLFESISNMIRYNPIDATVQCQDDNTIRYHTDKLTIKMWLTNSHLIVTYEHPGMVFEIPKQITVPMSFWNKLYIKYHFSALVKYIKIIRPAGNQLTESDKNLLELEELTNNFAA
jgi:hypothetical protein